MAGGRKNLLKWPLSKSINADYPLHKKNVSQTLCNWLQNTDICGTLDTVDGYTGFLSQPTGEHQAVRPINYRYSLKQLTGPESSGLGRTQSHGGVWICQLRTDQ